ncbi:MAG: hypothetical protein WC072_08730, partial [Methanoregulaceae archaeon]
MRARICDSNFHGTWRKGGSNFCPIDSSIGGSRVHERGLMPHASRGEREHPPSALRASVAGSRRESPGVEGIGGSRGPWGPEGGSGAGARMLRRSGARFLDPSGRSS